jgi:TPR repeat protein
MRGRRGGFSTILFLAVLLLPAMSKAGPYEDGDAAFHSKNYSLALQLWRPLAESGHAGAQVGLARMYYGGHEVALDYEQAAMWSARAADQGDANGQYLLGALYRDGKGVERDRAKAMALLLKSAKQGVPGAQYNLGLMYMEAEPAGDYREAYYWLALAASANGEQHAELRATAAFVRDDAAAKLSADQIAELKRRIGEGPAPTR